MSERRNPSYYDSLIDPFIRPDPEKENRIIQDLDSSDVKVIVHYSDQQIEETGFRDILPGLNHYINIQYIKVREHGRYAIYVPSL